MQENSLTIFERGNQLLAEANTVQKAKELKDLALTAADWAKHKGLGEEAVKLAMSYAMDASRRMGELLQATERADKETRYGSTRQEQPQKTTNRLPGYSACAGLDFPVRRVVYFNHLDSLSGVCTVRHPAFFYSPDAYILPTLGYPRGPGALSGARGVGFFFISNH